MTNFDAIDPSDPLSQLAGFDSESPADVVSEGVRAEWRALNTAEVAEFRPTRERKERPWS